RTDVDLVPSFARGGFSTVWGAAVLPFRAEEIADWPIRLSDLEPHYRKVLEFTPLAGTPDALETLFPLYSEKPQRLPASRQAAGLLRHWESRRERLNASGILFGQARLAVRNEDDSRRCRACGLCLYGCPYGCIYSSDQTLMEDLLNQPEFTYAKDVIVEKVLE